MRNRWTQHDLPLSFQKLFGALEHSSAEEELIVLDGYELLDLVSGGGCGVVFKAREVLSGSLYALKIPNPDMRRKFSESYFRMQREFETNVLVQSEYVATTHRIVSISIGGTVIMYLVMELVDGKDLGKVITEDGPLMAVELLHVSHQLSQGLDAVHAAGVLHRDIKPHNAVRAASGNVKWIDFGLAKFLDPSEISLTPSDLPVGTWQYTAPEVRESNRNASEKSDVYSLGATFFHLAIGQLPPESRNGRYDGFSIAQILSRSRPDLPEDYRSLLSQMLAVEPSQRPVLSRAIKVIEACKVQAPEPLGIPKKLTLYAPDKTPFVFVILPVDSSVLGRQRIALGETPLTWQQLHAIFGNAAPQELTWPVHGISLDDAQAICAKASEILTQRIRLPTVQEWQYGYRVGGSAKYPCGNSPMNLREYAHYDALAPREVKSKEPNAWGFYDMAGLVWEWCLPAELGATDAQLCGGSYASSASDCAWDSCLTRQRDSDGEQMGMRLLLELDDSRGMHS